jgi:uncharacterized protein (TIGR03437 family)
VNGGRVLARGGVSTAYGRILADREAWAPGGEPLPLRLANIAVRVTDSRGTAQLARLVYTGAGWSNITFLVPENAAAGPAEVSIVRTDGSSSTAQVILADVAPGFFSSTSDARGPASGEVVQRAPGAAGLKRFAASECTATGCRAVPIPLSTGIETTVRLHAAGLRHAGPHAAVRVTVAGVEVPVVSFGAADNAGRDQVTIQLPSELRDAGETDVTMTVNHIISNVVRIHCGAL